MTLVELEGLNGSGAATVVSFCGRGKLVSDDSADELVVWTYLFTLFAYHFWIEVGREVGRVVFVVCWMKSSRIRKCEMKRKEQVWT